uniref:Uncharacterized protein n=1 Tax=Megaselia scalaris TaxID=36166 RepID=T1H1C2_MEGSC
MTETGATDDDLKEMIADKLASTKEGKCLKSCLMIRFKSMDDNGKLNKEGSLHIAKEITKNNEKIMELAGQILDACADLGVSADKCEAAEEYSECMIKKAKDLGLKEMVF